LSKETEDSHSSHLDDMIARAYEAVLDQDRFDELITLAEYSVSDPAAHDHLVRRKRDMDAHFETAEKLLANLSVPELVDDRPVLKLATDLTITSANKVAGAALGLADGAHLEDLDLDTDSLVQLREAITGRSENWPVIRVPSRETGKQVLLALSCGRGVSGTQEWKLSGVDRIWQPGASLAMQSLYGLTQSETDVLSLLVGGFAPAEIAEKRSRSVETVRQQIKSMIAKTRSSGTNELISLARAVGESAGRRRAFNTATSGAERREVRLRDGRTATRLSGTGLQDRSSGHFSPRLLVRQQDAEFRGPVLFRNRRQAPFTGTPLARSE